MENEMSKVELAETFQSDAIAALRSMLQAGSQEAPIDMERFPNLKVVITEGDKVENIVSPVNIPSDLEPQLMGKKVFVVNA
jgi:hypothetical protein